MCIRDRRGQNFSVTSRWRERAHFPHSSATEAPSPEWPPGGQTSSPIPTLHDHGPNSLTLATVKVSSYPKPYRPPQPYYRARATTPNPSEGSGRGRKRSKVTPTWEGQCFRAHPHRDRPHPHSICYGLEKTLMRFMTTAPLHTATHAHRGQR